MPVYAFLEKRVLTLLDVWRQNPNVSLEGLVDSPALFEFITQVRTTDGVWAVGFETAQDIISSLRAQFAHQMREGLLVLARMRGVSPQGLERLRGRALRTAIEKPRLWEYRLFAEALIDEVAAHADARAAHRLKLAVGSGEQLEGVDGLRWLLARGKEFARAAAWCNTINDALQEALGPPGQPGDAAALASVARQLADVYRHAIDLAQTVRRAHADDEVRVLANKIAELGDELITKIESAGPHMIEGLEAALSDPPGSPPRLISIDIVMGGGAFDDFEALAYRYLRRLGG